MELFWVMAIFVAAVCASYFLGEYLETRRLRKKARQAEEAKKQAEADIEYIEAEIVEKEKGKRK